MRTREQLIKIKEELSYAILNMIDVYDELIKMTEFQKSDESIEYEGDKLPTVNDLAKNEEESRVIVEDTDTNRGDTYAQN